ncbi:MAG: hypothetical protein M1457_10125 [bacterium]|nr:hypothetical protein [bacterium]
MTIGKREKIVIGAVVAIGAIFVLHMTIFRPKLQAYREAKEARDAAAGEVASFKRTNPETLKTFNAETTRLLQQLTGGLQKLDLTEPDVFLVPSQADAKLELPPNTPADKQEEVKKTQYEEFRQAKLDKQIVLVLNEIERLRGFVENPTTRMTFLGAGATGWAIPTQLPTAMTQMQGQPLWDQLKRVAGNKATLLNLTNPASQNLIRQQYEYDLYQMGLNVQRVKFLARKGEFVPLIYRLAVANLILKQIPTDRALLINMEQLTPQRLFRLLEIDLPGAEMKGAAETKMYFLYQQLRYLNSLLDLAVKTRVKEITDVVLRAYGFLEAQDKLALSSGDAEVNIAMLGGDDRQLEAQASTTEAAEGGGGAAAGGGGAEGGEMDFDKRIQLEAQLAAKGVKPGSPEWNAALGIRSGPATTSTSALTAEDKAALMIDATPKDTDIGYVVLIKLSYVADNTVNWTYLYNVLHDNPLAELDRLVVRSLSQSNPALQDLEVTPSFIFVPKLFNTQDTVQSLLAETGQSGSGPKPAAGDAASTATTAAAGAATP